MNLGITHVYIDDMPYSLGSLHVVTIMLCCLSKCSTLALLCYVVQVNVSSLPYDYQSSWSLRNDYITFFILILAFPIITGKKKYLQILKFQKPKITITAKPTSPSFLKIHTNLII